MFDFIYYSPFTNVEQSIGNYGHSFVDISTGGLLKRVVESGHSKGGAAFAEMSATESVKILRFIGVCYDQRVSMPDVFPRPLPIAVCVEENGKIGVALRGRFEEYKNAKHYDVKHVQVCSLVDGVLTLCDSPIFIFRVFGVFLASLLMFDWDVLVRYDDNALEQYGNVKDYAGIVAKCSMSEGVLREFEGLVDAGLRESRLNKVLADACRRLKRKFKGDVGLREVCKRAKVDIERVDELFGALYKYYSTKFGRVPSKYACYTRAPELFFELDKKWIDGFVELHCSTNPYISFLKFSFPGMSSGEMTYLSMMGRLFHVFAPPKCRTLSALTRKKDIVVFLDEAETTLHPEWQRHLVMVLIWFLTEFACGKSIHLIFASHSAMLLSDLPKENVVFLDPDGTRKIDRKINTFGANIFDLYLDSFFMREGLAGSFATQKLNKLMCKANLIVKNGHGEISSKEWAVADIVGDPQAQKYFAGLKMLVAGVKDRRV